MIIIKTVENYDELKELFLFFSQTLYEEAISNKEFYYIMGERYEEMKVQFKKNKSFIMFIKDKDKIIAGITGKNMNSDKITLSILAVKKEYRKKGLGKLLINEFESRCNKNSITNIDLGSRLNAFNLYLKLGYKPSLMVQVFDFVTIDDIRKHNKYKLKEKSFYQNDTYGFIIYEIDDAKNEYIDYFCKNVPTSYTQFIFEKKLN